MFCVVEHPVTVRTLADGREERHAWPPRVSSPIFVSHDDASRAAWADRARDPDGSFEVVEIVGHEAGVAVVRPVVGVLGGYGRGDAYEAEYWG